MCIWCFIIDIVETSIHKQNTHTHIQNLLSLTYNISVCIDKLIQCLKKLSFRTFRYIIIMMCCQFNVDWLNRWLINISAFNNIKCVRQFAWNVCSNLDKVILHNSVILWCIRIKSVCMQHWITAISEICLRRIFNGINRVTLA